MTIVESNELKEKIIELLQGDPLYAVIQDTPLEETLYTDPYLESLIEKKFYSTPEVASWFDITDAQLRYYIKPFEHYIFEDFMDNPSTSTLIRLNFQSILKLRMILLLKDEYRVKGLKKLLGIDENGYIIKKPPTQTMDLASPDDLSKKVEVLSNVLQEIMKTGLFNMQMNDENGEMHITINQEYLPQNLKLLSAESAEQLDEIRNRTEKIEKEQEGIHQQLQTMKARSKVDIAIKIRERQIESNVTNKLRNQALHEYMEQKKWGFFAKLFHSTHFELEKEQFIETYIKQHFQENLLEEMKKYSNN